LKKRRRSAYATKLIASDGQISSLSCRFVSLQITFSTASECTATEIEC
jgi:hypothetical protein